MRFNKQYSRNARTFASAVYVLAAASIAGCGRVGDFVDNHFTDDFFDSPSGPLAGSHAPFVVDDSYVALGGRFLDVGPLQGVLANDQYVSGAEANTIFTVAGGIVYLNEDGSFSYFPPANFVGTDAFQYSVFGGLNSSQGTVMLNVFEDADPFSSGDPLSQNVYNFDTLSCCFWP